MSAANAMITAEIKQKPPHYCGGRDWYSKLSFSVRSLPQTLPIGRYSWNGRQCAPHIWQSSDNPHIAVRIAVFAALQWSDADAFRQSNCPPHHR